MFDRVEPEAVEFVGIGPPDGVIDQGADRRVLGKVEGGKIRFEPGGELLLIPEAQILFPVGQVEGAEPVAVLFPPGVLFVHMMQNEVGDHFHAAPMRVFNQIVQITRRSDVRIHLGGRDGPVAVITGVPTVGLGRFLISRVRILV